MAPLKELEPTGLIYRLNAGYRFRLAGGDANNDGIHVDMDIGYQSQRYLKSRLSFETGSTVDFFGETAHLGAYFQLNLHHWDRWGDRWVFSLRTVGAGVGDEEEGANVDAQAGDSLEDTHDFGGIFEANLMGAVRVHENLFLGLRLAYNLQAYGEKGTDQGTQHSLATLANLAYQF